MVEYYTPRVALVFDRTGAFLILLAAMFTITWLHRSNELTALFAAWPVAALVWEHWRSDPVHPRTLGVALGVAAGAAAAVLVDLWCPVGHVPHVLTGHVAPILLLGSLGALAGARALGVRPQR